MPDIRDAQPNDADAIARIYNASIEARDSTMRQALVNADEVIGWVERDSDRQALLVLDEGDTVIGWAIVKPYSDRAGYRHTGETSIFLRRDRTGRGYGSQLQAALIERCRTCGYHHLVAKIWAQNAASIAMHEKFGYEIVGVQNEVGFVDGEWQDVAIMQKLLDGTPAT